MNLYLKYRPTTLEDIRGNEQVTSALEGMLSDIEKCPHSFLLHGPTGCGKTTLARIIATRIGATGMDFHELDSAHFRGIDTIREIRKQANFMTLGSKCKLYLLDECHKLTGDAQNALLKILEDTPEHVYFVLCTTEPVKLLKTIRGRCSEFQVNPLSEREMFGLLRSVVKAEDESITKQIYEQIYQDSLGQPRNALQILDQVLRVDTEQRLEVAQRAAAEQSESIALCRALLDERSTWKQVASILQGLKDQDAEGIRRHVLGYANGVLIRGTTNDRAGLILEEFRDHFYDVGSPGLTLACYTIIRN